MHHGQKFDVGTLSSTITTDAEEIFHHSEGCHRDPARELLRAEATLESLSAAVRSFIFEDRRSSKRMNRCRPAVCLLSGLLKCLFQYCLSCFQALFIIYLCSLALWLWPNDCKDRYRATDSILGDQWNNDNVTSSLVEVDATVLTDGLLRITAQDLQASPGGIIVTILVSGFTLIKKFIIAQLHTDTEGVPLWRWLRFILTWPLVVVVRHLCSVMSSSMFILFSLIFDSQAKIFAAASDAKWGDCVVTGYRLMMWRWLMHDLAHPSEFRVPMPNAEHFHPLQAGEFSDLYHLTLNVLRVLFLWSLFGRFGQVGLAYLLLRSHHNHAAIGMQEALVEETILRRLALHCLGTEAPVSHLSIPVTSPLHGMVSGVNIAHWQAIRFLTKFPQTCAQINVDSEGNAAELRDQRSSLQSRATTQLNTLSTFLADRLQPKCQEGDVSITSQVIKTEAVRSLDYITHPAQRIRTETDERHVFYTPAELAAKSIKELDGQKRRFPGSLFRSIIASISTLMAYTCTVQPKGDLVIKKSFMVSFMKAYLEENPFIQVQVLESSSDRRKSMSKPAFITDAFAAMRLAYCLFFTMKDVNHATVSIDDVALQELQIFDGENRAQDDLLDPKHLGMLLDRDGNGVVTLQEFVDMAKAVYHKRQFVANAVLGDGCAIRQVEFAMNVVVSLATLFVLLFLMCPSQVETAWQTLTIGVAVLSVIFATTIREQSEAAMYYFMIRPFALGDAITYNATRYKVKSMTLLSVELVRYDGTSVTVSTTELRRTHVHNLTRSRETQLELRFMVDDLDQRVPHLLKTVSKCVRQCTRLHKRLFHGPFNVWLSQTGPSTFVCVAFELRNKGKDIILTKAAKTVMHEAVSSALVKMRDDGN